MAIPQIQHYPIPSQVMLSRPALPWTPAPERAALLIHDMQNHFLKPYASQAFVDTLVQRIQSVRAVCHALGMPVYYTAQPGDQSVESRGLLCDLWGPGLAEDGHSPGIVAGLTPDPRRDVMLVKHRYSAFARSDLLERLRAAGRDQLIICGVYAHIGCLVTATDAFMADIQPFVLADALGDFSLERHQLALEHMAHCSSVVLSTRQLLDTLAPTRPAHDLLGDVARCLALPKEHVAEVDDPVQLGLDSVRLLMLFEQWQEAGLPVTFLELLERRSIRAWSQLIDQRRQAQVAGEPA
ncbi:MULTISPECIES: isochorismatase family protein [unclassified Pseudomonas]|uniref:isochorismatase family protein n=1 Tax=unclassified Pseudomonas TaxID=196821 RepID=UPI00244C7B45|nr:MULTISPECIES: isochorismatase family protein [unclassified Pseudomonas]MDH0304195.1 isochorismatase family protein [Pseudomonas sp. GD04091]MDH1986202.1 isochorismatase family protein [Pseudomonas sp. GD03689]